MSNASKKAQNMIQKKTKDWNATILTLKTKTIGNAIGMISIVWRLQAIVVGIHSTGLIHAKKL